MRKDVNTFWACDEHKNNNTLKCAICLEKELKTTRDTVEDLRDEIATLEEAVAHWRTKAE